MDDQTFINKAIQLGLLNFKQAQEALSAQRAMAQTAGVGDARVWEILVLKRILTREQVDTVMGTAPRPKGFTFGPYTVISKLGEGGMGVVYLARKGGDEKDTFAVKVLPERLSKDAEFVKRFQREAKISVDLRHPNLVRGYEFGQINGRWYLAMEFVKGQILGERIPDRGMVERDALRIVGQIAAALDAVHKYGLVHRDIKPDNVIIAEDGTAKLMDLGLAKSVLTDHTGITQSGMALGTPHYMSPEQIEGSKELDIRSDVYSLGATLYHMLTGTAPFPGTHLMEILRKQLDHQLEDPRHARPDLSEHTLHVLERMMAHSPDDRYQTPRAMAEDLEALAAGRSPKSARLEAGRSIIRRAGPLKGRVPAPVARPAPAPNPKATRRLPPPRSSRRVVEGKRTNTPLVVGGIAAVLVLVGILAAVLTSRSSRPPMVREPGRSVDAGIEATVREHLGANRLNDAAALLNSPGLEPSKRAELATLVRTAAADLWREACKISEQAALQESYPLAKSRLEAFRSQAGQVEDFASRIEAELARLADKEKQFNRDREAFTRFKEIEEWLKTYEAKKDYRGAVSVLESALANAQTNPKLRGLIQDRLDAIKPLVSVPTQTPTPPTPTPSPKEHPKPADPAVDAQVARAARQLESSDAQGALETLTEALRKAPDHAGALGLRARCFLAKGNRSNAEIDANRAASLDPSDPDAQLVLGLLKVDEGAFEESRAALTRAISGRPTLADAYLGRARASAGLRDWTSALADL
ncbi:MAG TPA: protein kinase, partial [Planctomycetota bacterium]|nr:protein kinase [Planctomycetota bacterium]